MADVAEIEPGAPELSVVLGPHRALGEPRLVPLSAGSPARGSSSSTTAAADEAPEWVMVLPLGRVDEDPNLVEVRDWRPDFRCSDPERLVEEFNERVERDGPVVIDRNHAELLSWLNPDTPAAGWLSQLVLREDGIWGRSSWTPRGARELGDREYGYTSAVVSLVWAVSSTGERDYETPPEVGRICGLSICNSPGTYTKWLAALRQQPEAYMAGYGLAPFSAAAAEQLRTEAERFSAKPSTRPQPEPRPGIRPMSNSLPPSLPPAALAALEKLGLSAEASVDEVDAAVARLGADSAVVNNLVETVESLQRDAKDRRIDDIIAAALDSGRLTPGAVEVYRELGRSNGPEMLERALTALAARPLDRREGQVELETAPGPAVGDDVVAYANDWGLSPDEMRAAVAHREELPKPRVISDAEAGDVVRVGA